MATAAGTKLASGSDSPVAASARARCVYCALPMPGGAAAEPGPAYCCFGCRFAAQVTQASGESGSTRWLLARLGLSLFCSMGVMVFTIYLYARHIYHDAATTSTPPLEQSLTDLMKYLSLLFTSPVLVLLGWPILRNAGEQLRQRLFSTDALIVLGVGAAFCTSYIATLRGDGATYYETVCMVLVLVTFGRWLEATGKLKATESIQALSRLLPSSALVRHGSEFVKTAVDNISPGDVLLVPAGERVPADGLIIEGQATIDDQILSGESRSRLRRSNDDVHAGTIPLDAPLTIRVTQTGADSTIGNFLALLEQAKTTRSRFERLADRVTRLFVPVVVVLAAAGAALGYDRGGGNEAVLTALAVLLIACPCALGIATPLAIWAGLGRAGRHGVLFRNSAVLESLASADTVCFDKTGTLTTGQPTVRSFCTVPATPDAKSDPARSDHLRCAHGLAVTSAHVYAEGVAAFCRERDVEPAPVNTVQSIGGRGLSGRCGDRAVALGNMDLMAEQDMAVAPELERRAGAALSAGYGVVFIGMSGETVGFFEVTEALRTGARPALEQIRALGCETLMLTGDHPVRAALLAAKLDLAARAGLRPEGKTAAIRELADRGRRVVMVGDGLNDAASLATADVGIALGCGADLSRESGDVCLLNNDVERIPWLIGLARRTVRTIRVNLFWAFAYNVAGIGLALAGRLNPIIAAGAMVISSLLVVSNSLKLSMAQDDEER